MIPTKEEHARDDKKKRKQSKEIDKHVKSYLESGGKINRAKGIKKKKPDFNEYGRDYKI